MGTRNLPRKTRKINTLILIQNITQLNNSNNNDNDNNNDNNNNETYYIPAIQKETLNARNNAGQIFQSSKQQLPQWYPGSILYLK